MPIREISEEHLTLAQILDIYIHDGRLLPEESIIPLSKVILGGLACLHQKGDVYGCLKPDDVVLSSQAGFFLLEPKSIEEPSAYCNKIDIRSMYIAPEALQDWTWTTASDIFSAGIVLGESLLGRHPFLYHDNESLEDIQWHIGYDPPFIPSMLPGQTMDRGLFAFVCAMLIKEPHLRPSAEDLLGTIKRRNQSVQPMLPERILTLHAENGISRTDETDTTD